MDRRADIESNAETTSRRSTEGFDAQLGHTPATATPPQMQDEVLSTSKGDSLHAMRVLLVHNRYRSPGGEERHIDLLEQWLPSVGVEVRRFEVVSPDEASPLTRLRLGATLTYRPAGARLLRGVLDQEKPDVVHFHNVFPLLTPAAMLEARRHGAAVALTVHNYRFACPSGTLLRNGQIHDDCVEGSSLLCGLRNSRNSWSESIAYGVAIELQRRLRLLHRWIDAYVAPSAFQASMLARAGYPEERIHVIYHGVQIAKTPSEEGRYALYAGRLSPEKGTATLIAAARLHPAVPIVIAGTGPLAPLVRAATGNGVSYVGQVGPDDVAALIRGALFSLMPSECYEGQPFGALEAMAGGTPLVASRLGGLAEIVQDGINGKLVAPGDPRNLAAVMGDLARHPGRAAEMGVKAWECARDQFDITRQVSLVADLYRRLAPRAA